MFLQKIARIIVRRKFSKSKFDERSFSGAFNKCNSILVMMPDDEDDFNGSIEVLLFLEELKKEIVILTNDFRISVLPFSFRGKSIGYEINDINKLMLPSKAMISKIEKKKFNAVIDLNRKEQLFYSYISIIANADLRIGFTKKFADRIYNLQVLNDETNTKNSYKNLLNCLKML